MCVTSSEMRLKRFEHAVAQVTVEAGFVLGSASAVLTVVDGERVCEIARLMFCWAFSMGSVARGISTEMRRCECVVPRASALAFCTGLVGVGFAGCTVAADGCAVEASPWFVPARRARYDAIEAVESSRLSGAARVELRGRVAEGVAVVVGSLGAPLPSFAGRSLDTRRWSSFGGALALDRTPSLIKAVAAKDLAGEDFCNKLFVLCILAAMSFAASEKASNLREVNRFSFAMVE